MDFLLQVSNFKVLLLVFSCLNLNSILQISAYSKSDFDKLAKSCNVPQEDLEISKKYEVPDSETGKCFQKCTLEKFGMITPSGELSKEASIITMVTHWPRFSAELNTQLATECYNQVSPLQKELAPGSCELAYKMMKCLNVESRKHGYYKDFLRDD